MKYPAAGGGIIAGPAWRNIPEEHFEIQAVNGFSETPGICIRIRPHESFSLHCLRYSMGLMPWIRRKLWEK